MVGMDAVNSASAAVIRIRARASSSCQRRSRSRTQEVGRADALVGLGRGNHAEGGRIDRVRLDARLGQEAIGVQAELLEDVVLEHPVDDDHVGADQLVEAGHLLVADEAVVGDELQVEVGDPGAGVALARRRLADVAPAPPEAEVAALDRVEEDRAVDLLGRGVHERGVAFELGQPERRPQGRDDRRDEVADDVLGVIELDPAEVVRVAGDVRDQEAGRVADGEHHRPTIARACDRFAIGGMGRSASLIQLRERQVVSIHLPTYGRPVAVLFLVLSVAACSSSTPTAPDRRDRQPVRPDLGAGRRQLGSRWSRAGGGSDAAYCAAMKVADAQALVKVTIAAAQTGGPESCAFVLPGEDINGDNLTVTVFPGDGNHQYYNDSLGGPVSGATTPIPGVGDVAVWEQPAVGASAPEVGAYKGSLTCIVQPPADTSQLTIDQTGTGPIYNITAAAAAAYAAKEAVLCTDMFSVGS